MLEPLRRTGKLPRFNKGNSIAEKHPDVAKFWSKRNEILPTEVSANFNESVLWECRLGHESLSKLQNKILRPDYCPVCEGKQLLRGYNDAETTAPELLTNWDYELNDLLPSEVLPSGIKKYWWKCDNEPHSFQETFNNIRRGRGCPYCRGLQVLPGFNDIASEKHLLKEWDYEKNKVDPETVIKGTHKKYWWVCPEGHSYLASGDKKTRGRGCSYCAGKRVTREESLGKVRKDLAKMWIKEVDGEHTPFTITLGSSKEVLWRSEGCGHKFTRTVKAMSAYSNCPYCPDDEGNPLSNRKLLIGFNDFKTVSPEAAKEWDCELNEKGPEHFVAGTTQKAHFICSKGHNSYSPIGNRTKGFKCPHCSNSKSKGELEVLEFLKELGEETVSGDRETLGGLEIDVYLPEHKLGVEYNGLYWHSEEYREKDYHYKKFRKAQEAGIDLLQIWEDDWIDRREIVEKMLLYRLGKLEERVGARETVAREVEYRVAKDFLDNYHLQGGARGFLYLGLYNEGELVAVAVFRRSGEATLLSRYATSKLVPGGLGKLLKEARKRGVKEVVTFSDNEVSSGKIYSSLGFKKDGEIAPDYSYLVDERREHKFNYRKKRFREDTELLWREGLTERELAELNELERVWDAGKVRWRKVL